ncbi:MAG: EamA family transporter [Actinomycetota bacterium]|nr:EamA family transporter [Actinomycetota bacterium]MDH4353696.1 EamA family transporter [Actinomycetota bacterium]
MTAIALALVSSLAYGFTDFFGGMASRRTSVLVVGAISQPAGLVLLFALVPVFGGTASSSALLWGAASGAAGAVAFMLLFRSLAIGPMSIASPLSALTSAVLPVFAGVAFGEQLTGLIVAGIVVGLVAVLLVSREHDDTPHPVSRRVVAMSLTSGVFIAMFFIALERSPDDSGLWPLITSRAMAAVVMVVVGLASGVLARPGPGVTRLILGAAALDAIATAAFLLATREGLLAVVAVITALYPAGTLLMARVVLGERMQLVQKVGLGLAGGSVVLLALAG